MAGIKLKKNAKDTWVRRLLIKAIILFRKSKKSIRRNRNSKIVIIGSAAAVIVVVVFIIVITNAHAHTKMVSNTSAVPTYSTSSTTPVVTAQTQELTPTPTPIPTTTPPSDPTLKFGDENEKVQELQQRLMNLGYLDLDEPTQKFGPATKTAVQWFQRQVGTDQTGIADADTLGKLYANDAPSYTLKQGTRGSDVDGLQTQLEDLGYLDANKATGYYGTETITAVKEFQQRNKLSADGKTGKATLALIYSPKARPSASKAAEARVKANVEKMISVAQGQLGKPYVSGAEGSKSFDCSGLVYYCLKQAGSNRGRYNAQGYSAVSDWNTISKGGMDLKKLKRGDLLFFHVASRDRPIGHVAIYIGDGTVIDASSSNGKVVKRSCTGHWFTSCFRFAKRPW